MAVASTETNSLKPSGIPSIQAQNQDKAAQEHQIKADPGGSGTLEDPGGSRTLENPSEEYLQDYYETFKSEVLHDT